jgi:hypothetical protein
MSLKLDNLDSLITIEGTNQCLGYLMYFEGKGTFDADHGKVDVSKEQVDTHNNHLDEAMLKGLDENCEIGQHGTFYVDANHKKISTFIGTVVSDVVEKKGPLLTFTRKGKRYRGRTSKHHDLFNFKRIA